MAININRNVEDCFYRYKMPRLIAKVEGKGNGIKTVIVNMPEIAKSLCRPPAYPTKYFGCELGAQTQIDHKNDRYIVNGDHDAGKLQDILDGFIRRFVLCQNCDNPETVLTVKSLGGKKHEISQSCLACGHLGFLDQKHRLATFIIKNPPPIEDAPGAGKKTAAAAKKNGSGERGSGTPSGEEDGDDCGFGDFEVDDDNHGGKNGADEEDNDAGWTAPVEEEKGTEELSGAMKALIVDQDLEKSIEDRLDMFYNYIQKKMEEAGNKLGDLDGKVVVQEADRLEIKDKAGLLLCRALFTKNILQEIEPASKLLLRFLSDHKKAQRYFLGGIEQLVTAKENKEALLPKVPHILKALYENDIVDEETILEWGKKPSKKYVSRKESEAIIAKADPFLKWLEEAESESDSDEEDEVDFESADTPAPPAKPISNGVAKPAAAAPVQNGNSDSHGAEDEEDLDIDDI